MSWFQEGSSALATLSALVANDNHRPWFEERRVDFRLAGSRGRARLCEQVHGDEGAREATGEA